MRLNFMREKESLAHTTKRKIVFERLGLEQSAVRITAISDRKTAFESSLLVFLLVSFWTAVTLFQFYSHYTSEEGLN